MASAKRGSSLIYPDEQIREAGRDGRNTAWEHPPDDVNDPKPPHWLMVDLGAPKSISGFSCLPRQTGTNGRIKDWEVYGSQDGKSWGDPLKGGAFSDDDELHTVLF